MKIYVLDPFHPAGLEYAAKHAEVVKLVDRVVGIRDGQITHLALDEVVAGEHLRPDTDAGAGDLDRYFRRPEG